MSRKLASFILILSLIVMAAMFSQTTSSQSLNNKQISTTQSERVHNLDTGLNYTTIQKAIDAPETDDGHTIFVEEGTYHENLVVDKSISLLGESKDNTIINGNSAGTVINVVAENVRITGFSVQNSGPWPNSGVYMVSSNNNVSHNVVLNNSNGIWLHHSHNNNLIGNSILNNTYGIIIEYSSNNSLVENCLLNNEYNFCVFGEDTLDFINHVDKNNMVNGKPIYYLIDVSNAVYDATTNLSTICLINCDNITIRGLTLQKNGYGVFFWNTTNSKIENATVLNNGYGICIANSSKNTLVDNTALNNSDGILLYCSSDNILTGNNASNNKYYGIRLDNSSSNNILSGNTASSNNEYGIALIQSGGNVIFHDNFSKNKRNAYSYNSINIWDDGYPSGGNYWSDYNGTDANGDGIGDTPYVIDENNQDSYPLMSPIDVFYSGTWDEIEYYVDVISNSTVSGFHFNPDEGAFLRFNVTGESGTIGLCRVTIPKSLLWVQNGWTIIVGGEQITDYTITSDEDYTYLHFVYSHSTKTVQITGTHVIPEFPSFLILPLFMITTLLAVVVYRRKHSVRMQKEIH